MDADEQKAAQAGRLASALESLSFSVTDLDLSDCGLSELPNEIFSLGPTLKKLNLANNHLSDLPTDIARLTKCRILFCLNNNFVKVPLAVASMASLFMLSFKSNQLELIPEESLGTSIGWLILTNNKLKTLPQSIGRLTKLRKLMLASNELHALPDTFANLSSLELVRLSDNCLPVQELSKLSTLPSLAWLAFAGQRTTESQTMQPRNNGAISISFSDLTIGSILGEGASGTVYRGELHNQRHHTLPVAVKIYKPCSSDGLPMDEVIAATFVPSHPNLIKVIGTFSEPQLGMVMELLENVRVLGNTPSFESVTRDVLDPNWTLSPSSGLGILQCTCSSLFHLHQHGVMHGDVYGHNTLVKDIGYDTNDDGHAKLGDFGAAFIYGHNNMAPFEQFEVRAFGCLIEDVINLLPKDHVIIHNLQQIATDCTQQNPSARPVFAQLVARLSLLQLP